MGNVGEVEGMERGWRGAGVVVLVLVLTGLVVEGLVMVVVVLLYDVGVDVVDVVAVPFLFFVFLRRIG